MAEFVPVSTGLRTATSPLTLRSALVLTTAYVASTAASVIGWGNVVFRLNWASIDYTTMQFYVEGYDGTNWTILGYQAVQGSGVSALTQDIRQITVASFATTDSVTLPPVDCVGLQQLRISIKRTGGTAVGTMEITATASINVSARSA